MSRSSPSRSCCSTRSWTASIRFSTPGFAMPEQPPESAGTALADELETTGLAADAFTVEVAGITAGVRPARKRRLGIGAWLAIVWLVGLILAAIAAPILPIADPNETFTSIQRAQAPFATIEKSGGG